MVSVIPIQIASKQSKLKEMKETLPSYMHSITKITRKEGIENTLLSNRTRLILSQNIRQFENKRNAFRIKFSNKIFYTFLKEHTQSNSTAGFLASPVENESVLNTLLGYEKSNPMFTSAIATSSCPSNNIRQKIVFRHTTKENVTRCVPHIPKKEDCAEAQKMYKIDQYPLSCEEQPGKQLCSVVDTSRTRHDAPVKVRCDLSRCGVNPVYVASIDPSLGKLQTEDKWLHYFSREKLEIGLSDIISRNSLNGFNFCFIRCKHSWKTGDIFSLLTFPPIMKEDSTKPNRKLFNFNILVLDSVSRGHFYRSLPQSITTLRDIVHNPKIKATALDFELLQSIAPHTFQNMKGFFSGSSAFDHDAQGKTIQKLGIKVLFNDLRKRSYQTLLQEDVCWYDEWGTLLQNNIMQGKKPVKTQQFRERWKKFRKDVTPSEIDDEGLSVFSCEVFKLFNSTNQFNRPRKVCFDGRPLAEYFIRYQQSFLTAYKNSAQSKPFFSYTHLATGHEVSGQRIRQIDKQLSQFLYSSSQEQNTLTFVFSDHGEKTTPYSLASLKGRLETYDSFLFAIVPAGVAQKLGKDRLRSMIVNQQKLISTKELHNAIMSIGNSSRENSKDFHKEGIFAEVPADRECSSLSMQPLVMCKCAGWEEWLSKDDPTLHWISEFALGQINNKIQQSVSNTRHKFGNSSGGLGFLKCQRLSGYHFDKARRRKDGKNFVVSLDVVAVPLYQFFEFQVRYPIKTPWPNPREKGKPKMKPVARLSSFRRISVYNDFAVCCDEGVQLQLCVCSEGYSGKRTLLKKFYWSNFTTQEGFLKYITNTVYFRSRTEIKVLHGTNCLLLLTRSHHVRTKVLEIANSCIGRKYELTVSGRSNRIALISSPLPMRLVLFPRKIHFLFTVYHHQKPYDFTPDIQFKIVNL